MSIRPQLRMKMNRFYDLPSLDLPAGVALRRIHAEIPEELERWVKVLDSIRDLVGEWTIQRARETIHRSRVLPESIHLLTVDGEAIATACVEWDSQIPHQAELGYVGVVPRYRGQGLGYWVSLAVLHYVVEQGYQECVLRTDDHRVSAIKTYLRLGFEADYAGDASYPERWAQLWQVLGLVPKRPFRIGIVGKRGMSAIRAARALPEVEIAALCDVDETTLNATGDRFGIEQRYTEYERMLDADIDAVIVATPMPLHVPQSVQALERGKHVLSEVPASVSYEESWQLLEAAHASDGVYMMAENYCYIRNNVLVRELVRKGLFGEVYFGQGAYIHELKGLNEETPWRRVWQTGKNGNTYPTHSLGPLMQWMNDRVVTVSCMGSGHHYRDAKGRAYENEDCTITLCKLERGGMVQLRLDMLSNRPHHMDSYALQGTKGCYETARAQGAPAMIWLESESAGDTQAWRPLTDFEAYLPEFWRNPPEAATGAGHGGGDYWVVWDFAQALCGRKPPSIDAVTALEWTAAGLASQVSIARGGAPVDLPDYRAAWKAKRA